MLQYLGAEDSGLTLLSSKPTIPTRNWARFSESGFDTHPLCTPHIREIPECGSHAPLEVQKKKKTCPEGVCVSETGRICLLGIQKTGSPKMPASAQAGAFVLDPAPWARKEHRRAAWNQSTCVQSPSEPSQSHNPSSWGHRAAPETCALEDTPTARVESSTVGRDRPLVWWDLPLLRRLVMTRYLT